MACMQLGNPKACEAQVTRMSRIRDVFGLGSGGALALTALALLTGGDYLVSGLCQVGATLATAVIKHLLQGHSVRLQPSPAESPSCQVLDDNLQSPLPA